IPCACCDAVGTHDGELEVTGAAGPLAATDVADRRPAAREAELHDQLVVDLPGSAGGALSAGEDPRRRLSHPPAREVDEVDTVVQRVAAGQLGVQHPCLPARPDPSAVHHDADEPRRADFPSVDELADRQALVAEAVAVAYREG